MRFFNSGNSNTSSYIIVSPKEKDKIPLVEFTSSVNTIDSNVIKTVEQIIPKEEKKSGGKLKFSKKTLKLSKENNNFLKALKSGSGFKRI